jgi:hypothetical protein
MTLDPSRSLSFASQMTFCCRAIMKHSSMGNDDEEYHESDSEISSNDDSELKS